MAEKDSNFTDKETKLLCAMIECLEGPLKINWAACAAKTGHASGTSAQRQWYKIKARKGIGENEAAAASPTANKRKRGGDDDGNTNGANGSSPTKKTKGGKKGKQANGTAGSSDDDDGAKIKAEQDGDECV